MRNMDEDLSWKIILFAALFSLALMGGVYFLISPKDSTYFSEEKEEKVAEFTNTRVAGRKEGKKIWEFVAKTGWSSRNREITHLFGVTEGVIYKSGNPVVTQLIAPHAKAFRRSNVVEIFAEKKPLHSYINLGTISGRPSKEWSKLSAKYLKYMPKSDQIEISGNVSLIKKESSIYSQKIIINTENNYADISDNVRLKRKDAILFSDMMKYFSNDEKIEADGHVDITIDDKKIKTRIKANHAILFSDINRDILLDGNLEAVQGKKYAVADSGIYSKVKRDLLLKGNVKAIFEKARAIIKESTANKLKSKEAKNILKEKTVLTSNQLVFSTRTGDANASGSVFVSQKGREAKADRAVYNDKSELLTLTGNVFLKKKTQWVKAEKVIISVKDESFEATGQVETEFTF
jgi:lipopolysaccharide assembly outer membrane protein LptD (OstA)